MTISDVRNLLLQLWPPGRLYDWSAPTSNVSRFLDGLAEAFKRFGYDLVDHLRRELNPATAVEKLPDWEHALGLEASYTARHGTIEQRQAAVVAKLREFGALTRANARAILAPLLGYVDAATLAIVETSRAKMRAAHTYTDGKQYPSSTSIGASVYVDDGGKVSRAGAQLDLEFATLPTQAFAVYLVSPTNRQRVWNSTDLGPPSLKYRLCAPDFVGDTCNGTWRISIVALVFFQTVPALTSWSSRTSWRMWCSSAAARRWRRRSTRTAGAGSSSWSTTPTRRRTRRARGKRRGRGSPRRQDWVSGSTRTSTRRWVTRADA